MIQDLEIQNFRCFEKLKVSGFGKVNLISGKNNAGKTALLEALFLGNSPIPDTVLFLQRLREETLDFSQALPQRTWNNFFFNQDQSKHIFLVETFNDHSRSVDIFIDQSHSNFVLPGKNGFNLTNNKFIEHTSIGDYHNSAICLWTKRDLGEYITAITSSSKGLVSQENLPLSIFEEASAYANKIKISDLKNTFFLPSALKTASKYLTAEYDKARFNNKDEEVLKAFQIIDSSIIEVTSFSIGEPTIYLKRENQERLPLALFGDAINRIADIILKIVNNENCTLLIDEIENGIHYTNHENFWNILFKLAEALNVQIFCTTHSLEMMQAFVKAGEKYQDSGAHFELARHAKSGNIVAIRRDLETLGYGIEHHRGVRGE